MGKRIKHVCAPIAVAAALLVLAPVTQADTKPAPLTGAAYFVPGVAHSHVNAAAGNGVAGRRSALDVPEPSSWLAFGFGVVLIGGMSAIRRRRTLDL
jgi:hypothetical protein